MPKEVLVYWWVRNGVRLSSSASSLTGSVAASASQGPFLLRRSCCLDVKPEKRHWYGLSHLPSCLLDCGHDVMWMMPSTTHYSTPNS